MVDIKKEESMSWQRGKTKGSITVFLSMVLLVIVSLIAACLENARVQTASLHMERCLKGGMDAVLTEYYKPLYEDYRLFFMDKGIEADALEYRKIEKTLMQYLDAALSTTYEKNNCKENGIDLYKIGLHSVQVDSVVRATDYEGNLVVDEVLQYMKYAASVKELPLVSSYTKLAKDTQEFSEVMEIEDGVEQAFSVSSELLIKLMEQVEGITYGKNGLEVQSNGRIKVRDCFAKKICTDVPTKESVGVTNETVWQSLKGHYVNASASLVEIDKLLNTMLEKSAEQSENQVDIEKEKEKTDRKAKKQKDQPALDDFKREKKQIVQKQNALQKIVSNTIEETKMSIQTIEQLQRTIPELSSQISSYEKRVGEQKDKITNKQNCSLQQNVTAVKNDNSKIKQVVNMKSQLQKNLVILEGLEKELKREVGNTREEYEKKREGIASQLVTLEQYSIHSMVFSYGTIGSERVKNPVDTLKKLKGSAMNLTMPEGKKVSKKSTSNPDYYFKTYKGNTTAVENVNTGNYVITGDKKGLFQTVGKFFGGEKSVSNLGKDVTNAILYQAYIRQYFKSFVTKESIFEKTPLEYEQEYILCGQKSDEENLTQVVNRLLLLRTVTNFSYLLTDSVGMKKAYATAAALVGFTGLEPLIRATQITILTVWAYEESLVDVAALMQGNKVPLYKTRDTFMLSYSDILNFNKNTIQRKAKQLGGKSVKGAMNYEEYLTLFLLFEKQIQKTYRTMDMIEENMKLRHSKLFSFEKCIYSMKVKTDIQIPAKFAALSFLTDWEYASGQWNFELEQEYSY